MKTTNRISVLVLGIVFFTSNISFSQVTFTNGENSLEMFGIVAAYYNWRFLDANDPNNHINNNITQPLDKKNNTFGLGTARLNLYGMHSTTWEYRLEFDMDALATPSSSSKPGNYSPLLNAYMVYKPLKGLRITGGYQKVPYSASNLAYYANQPYWDRPLISSGDFFSRRDLGITIQQNLLNDHIRIWGGIYSGMGEYIVTNVTSGNGDSNGKPEYIGRIDFSTAKYDFNSIYDNRNSQRPVLSVGFNGRYTEKTQSITGLADYDLKIIAGKKTIIGMDAAFAYKGFSAQFEIHQLIITPSTTNADTLLLQGKNTTYFRAGGMFVTANYYNRKLKSGVYCRYENFCPNDLVQNNTVEQTLTFGYNFFLKGYKSMLRTQYIYRLNKNNPLNTNYNNDQLRIGWQYMF